MKLLPSERKFVMLAQLMDKIISSDLEKTVEGMIEKDPRLLCRLNLKNTQVAEIVKKKVVIGQVHPFDLLHDPEETLALKGLSYTEHSKLCDLTPDDAAWLEDLTDRFKKRSAEQAKLPDESREQSAIPC